MFAVPGWSVSSASLKTQDPSTVGKDGAKASRKRKRKDGSTNVQVTNNNVAELWEQHVGKKEAGPVSGANQVKVKARKAQPAEEDETSPRPAIATPTIPGLAKAKTKDEVASMSLPKAARTKKEKRKGQGSAGSETPKGAQPQPQLQLQPSPVVKQAPLNAPTTVNPAAKLTPLQAAMRQKLISARFRHLNQTLYTTPSGETLNLFDTNPTFFDEYHEGFRQQVSAWPENPVDSFVKELLQRGKVKDPRRDKKRPDSVQANPQVTQLLPLPRTAGLCTVADLGCGDAALGARIAAEGKKQNVKVLSYDLQGNSPLVIKADISSLPLENGAADVAIFCLALMGTNWVDFIDEAYRILHWKGELWVAEIKSRFSKPVKKVVDHSVGKRRKLPQKSGKKDGEVEDVQATLMVEVDGADSNKQQTDVSSFVQVLQKRGFVLNGEGAVDLSNRMFVKLKFIKAANPIKGKNVKDESGAAAKPGMKRQRPQFLENEDDATIDEASVLKPCLYKIR